MRGHKINLVGKVFGKLKVIREVINSDRKRIYWECVCDCGKTTVVRSENLRNSTTKSCGCLQRIKATTHGATNHPLFRVYTGMVERCCDENNGAYDNYGGRGIKVCDRWLNSIENFIEDMFFGYQNGLQLDRKDNDGNYEPSNCRWVTPQQNAMNRRGNKNTTSRYKGVYLQKKSGKWLSAIKKDGKKFFIGSFIFENEAALAYNKKAVELFGEYANLNIISEVIC